jgi:hypothetical protein
MALDGPQTVPEDAGLGTSHALPEGDDDRLHAALLGVLAHGLGVHRQGQDFGD